MKFETTPGLLSTRICIPREWGFSVGFTLSGRFVRRHRG